MTLIRRLSFFLFSVAAIPAFAEDAPAPQPVQQSVHKIAAVVNEDIVSTLEVEERTKFVITTTGLSNTPETKARLIPQIIRGLIDEKLQMQAAAQSNVSVGPDDIKQAIATIEKQRGKTPGSLVSYLVENGVSPSTFEHQLEAQLAWNQLISRKVRSQLTISDDELQREVERARNEKRSSKDEVLISSILLPVDKPENEANVQALAQKLVGEIRGGASFQAVASQLSSQQSLNTNQVWVEVDQLDAVLANAINQLGGTGLLDPLRTPSGYHIVNVHEKRSKAIQQDAEVLFKDITMRLKNDAEMKEVDVLMGIAREIAKNPGTCPQKGIAGISSFDDLDFDIKYTRSRFSGLSPEVVPLVKDLSVGGISEPFAAPDGIHLLMMCEKVALTGNKVNLPAIKTRLKEEKFQLEAMRYLRNLRREAFVEVRL